MFIARLYLFSVVYWLISVFGLGLVLTAVLKRARMSLGSDPASEFLCSVALGILWKSLQFAVLFAVGANFADRAVAMGVFVVDLAVILVATWIATVAAVSAVLRRVFSGEAAIPWIVGMLLGTWAFLQFPHTFDSGQLRWTQDLLFGVRMPRLESMIGFSGLIAFFGAIVRDIPLVAVAASLKPFLAVILVFLCQYVAASLDLRPRIVGAAAFFLLVLFSEFGLQGVVVTGKDSIYGVLFSIAFMVTLCRTDAAERGKELGLYFAAGAAIGIISVPFMAVAYGLWFLLAGDAWRTLRPMVLVNAPVLPLVLAAFTKQHVLVFAVGYAVLGVLAWCATSPGVWDRLRGGRTTALLARLSAMARGGGRYLTPVLIVLCYLLLPATLDFVVWYNVDGSAVMTRRAPLDGQHDLLRYLGANPIQASTIYLGVLASVLICCTRAVHARPGLVALGAMPFLILVGALAQVHTRVQVIPDFYAWDIIKDITSWYGGPLFAMFPLFYVNLLAGWVSRERARNALLVAASAAVALAPVARFKPTLFLEPVIYTAVGGTLHADMAVAAPLLWRYFRHRVVFVDRDTAIFVPFFFSFQMFGARAAEYSPDLLTAQTAKCCDRVGFIVKNSELPALRNFAQAHNGSLVQLGVLPYQGDAFVVIEFGGKSELGGADGRLAATLASGMYAPEKAGDVEYRWLRALATVAVSTKTEACVVFRLFAIRPTAEPQLVSLEGPGFDSVTVDISASSAARPTEARVLAQARTDTIRLKAAMPEQEFPNDGRPIAYGLQMPILVQQKSECR